MSCAILLPWRLWWPRHAWGCWYSRGIGACGSIPRRDRERVLLVDDDRAKKLGIPTVHSYGAFLLCIPPVQGRIVPQRNYRRLIPETRLSRPLSLEQLATRHWASLCLLSFEGANARRSLRKRGDDAQGTDSSFSDLEADAGGARIRGGHGVRAGVELPDPAAGIVGRDMASPHE